METYNFADQSVWGNDRLVDHYNRLQEIEQIPHSEPRKSQIARELVHIAFEYGMRCNEQAMPVVKVPEGV